LTKLRITRWAVHVTCTGNRGGAYGVLVGKHKERDYVEDIVIDGEDNNKLDLQEVGWGAWTGLVWLRIETGGGIL
jgi:hypothetical protein